MENLGGRLVATKDEAAADDGAMKIISVRAPWWWWIVYGGKDIENRDWPTSYRGPVLIHASKWWVAADCQDDWDSARAMERASGKPMVGSGLWSPNKIRSLGGQIVGRADIVDCVDRSASPWFVGRYGFVLANAAPVEPIPFKARLGLFDAPPEVLAQITRHKTRPTPSSLKATSGEK